MDRKQGIKKCSEGDLKANQKQQGHLTKSLTFSRAPISGLCHVSILMKKSSFMYSFWKNQETQYVMIEATCRLQKVTN